MEEENWDCLQYGSSATIYNLSGMLISELRDDSLMMYLLRMHLNGSHSTIQLRTRDVGKNYAHQLTVANGT
jgi:hypothetical protein